MTDYISSEEMASIRRLDGRASPAQVLALLNEVDRLRAALVQARVDALGEAAKVADEQKNVWQWPPSPYARAREAEAGGIAVRIRALQSTTPASAPPAVQCDGSGHLPHVRGPDEPYDIPCPGCPNCKSKERR